MLHDLNDPQRKAAEHHLGPAAVLAGPGAGKTRVLTRRIADLIVNRGADPRAIVAITFTNRAAREMRERLISLIGAELAGQVFLGTAHSYCGRLLRKTIGAIGRKPNFLIYDADDSKRLLRAILIERRKRRSAPVTDLFQLAPAGVTSEAPTGDDDDQDEGSLSAGDALKAISRVKRELISPEAAREKALLEDDRQALEIAELYAAYQRQLEACNALDFDDMLILQIAALDADPEMAADISAGIVHLLVDEYQDADICMAELVRRLGDQHRNVFVVGDAQQQIYRFRGARHAFRTFYGMFPDAVTYKLEQNYRSTRAIVDAASQLIGGLLDHEVNTQVWTANEAGKPVRIITTADDSSEAQLAARLIQQFQREGIAYHETAVIVRTTAQTRLIEEALVARGIPYTVVGGHAFYDRAEVKDLLAFLRVVATHEDAVSFQRTLSTPRCGVGEKALDTLNIYAESLDVSLFEGTVHALCGMRLSRLIEEAAQAGQPVGALFGLRASQYQRCPLKGEAAKGAARVVRLILSLQSGEHGITGIPAAIRHILKVVAYETYAQRTWPEEVTDRLANIDQLIMVGQRFNQPTLAEALVEMLAEITLMTDEDSANSEERSSRVTLVSCHRAKGLEWRAVVVPGMVEDLMPHFRSIAEGPEAIDEERRICYVAMTRAQERLFLTVPQLRGSSGGSPSTCKPSRFLESIDVPVIKDPNPATPPARRQFRQRA